MMKSVDVYAPLIERGEVNPVVQYDGKASGLLFDPASPTVPLDVLGFGVVQLSDKPYTGKTGSREFVFVPQEARYRIRTKTADFSGRRASPFTEDFSTNAGAVYLPPGCEFELTGQGEVIFYSAPAFGEKPAQHIKPGETPYVSRGFLSWRRDVVTLCTPASVTTNLVVGETYSPPGLWSGTPLHVHDGRSKDGTESNHEEVYYHIMRLTEGQMGPYGVQMLFDGERLNKSYIVKNKTAVAIPGVCHPVAASPVTDHIYGWGLAGPTSQELGMRDIPEFRHLKDFERVAKKLMSALHFERVLPSEWFEELCAEAGFSAFQRTQLRLMLKEYGLHVKIEARTSVTEQSGNA